MLSFAITNATVDERLSLLDLMCAFWLYILKHELHAEGCTLALDVSPTEKFVDGLELQTVNFKSWNQLAEALARAGFDSMTIRDTEMALDSEGLQTLREVSLSPEQLHNLGFKSYLRS